MIHLYIEQNTSGIEEVNSFIISKLYELAISGDLDNTSDLKGRLHSEKGHGDYVQYLNTNFQDLYITCNTYYLYLGDSTFSSILANAFGDGTGCTLEDMQNVKGTWQSIYPSGLTGNLNITDATGLKYLTRVNYAGSNMRYADGLNGCTNLRKCELPEGMTTLAAGTTFSRFGFFRECTNLTQVILPSTLKIIGSHSFYNCSSLTTITLPEGVTEIGDYSFLGTSLTQITLPSSVKKIGYLAFSGSGLTSIHIPNSVTTISSSVFNGCPLTSITFDHSTGENLSWNSGSTHGEGIICSWDKPISGITKIDFPERLTSVGQHPFRGLGNLTQLIFRNPTPISITSLDVPNECIVYVPDNAVNDYKMHNTWSSIADRIKGISELPS